MAVAVVDTGILVGMVDTDDRNHDVAMEIVRGMDHGDLPTGRVLNYVVLETLNWIHSRKHHQKALETYERLSRSAGFELIHAAQTDVTGALALFETYGGSLSGTQPSQRTCNGKTSSTSTRSTGTSTRSRRLPDWRRRTIRSVSSRGHTPRRFTDDSPPQREAYIVDRAVSPPTDGHRGVTLRTRDGSAATPTRDTDG
jgi:predicted nucleic acid-binding protein